jgi:hypothetical protein
MQAERSPVLAVPPALASGDGSTDAASLEAEFKAADDESVRLCNPTQVAASQIIADRNVLRDFVMRTMTATSTLLSLYINLPPPSTLNSGLVCVKCMLIAHRSPSSRDQCGLRASPLFET